eukprot:SAG22_NODE_187_length_15860_cov_44.770446_3_plen_205_part_00
MRAWDILTLCVPSHGDPGLRCLGLSIHTGLKKALAAAQIDWAVFEEEIAKKAKAKGGGGSDEEEEEEEEEEDEEEMAAQNACKKVLDDAQTALEEAEASVVAGVQFIPDIKEFGAVLCDGPTQIVRSSCEVNYVTLPVFGSEGERKLLPSESSTALPLPCVSTRIVLSKTVPFLAVCLSVCPQSRPTRPTCATSRPCRRPPRCW